MNGSEIDEFINDILDKKQLPGVTPDVREQLVSDLKERLLDQINRAVLDALPEDKLDELSELIDKNADEQAVQEFVVKSGVDVKHVTALTMLKFRSLYLGTETA